jgi:hypothetical protein
VTPVEEYWQRRHDRPNGQYHREDAEYADKTMTELWEEKLRPGSLITREAVCPHVGVQEFLIDTIRYCVLHPRGCTCGSFRVQPFSDCPLLTQHRILESTAKVVLTRDFE